MKRLGSVIAATLGIAASAQAQEAPDLVTILTTDEPQTQLMSMVLSAQALQQGVDVHILLCGPAGDFALIDAPASATAPQQPRGMSPQGLMQVVMQKGATVEVCAIYLPNKGVGGEALLDGISAADPAKMAVRLLAPNTRIMSN